MFLRFLYLSYLTYLVSSYFFPPLTQFNLLLKALLSPFLYPFVAYYPFFLALFFFFSVYALFLSISSCKDLSNYHFLEAIWVVLRAVVFFIVFFYNLFLTLSCFYYYENFSLFLEYFLYSSLLMDGPSSPSSLLMDHPSDPSPLLTKCCLDSHIDPIAVLGGYADLTRYPGFYNWDLILDEYSEKGKVFLEESPLLSSLYSKPVVAYDNPFTHVPDLQFYYKITQTPTFDVFDTSSSVYTPISEVYHNSRKCVTSFERAGRRLKSPFDMGHTCVELERSLKLGPNGHRTIFYVKSVAPERVHEFLTSPWLPKNLTEAQGYAFINRRVPAHILSWYTRNPRD